MRLKLTDVEWQKVFNLRCNSKRGYPLSEDEQALCERAHAEDPKRYGAMNADVFNETVPAGSNARYGAGPKKLSKAEIKALEVLETGPATGSNKSRHCIQGILRTVNTLTGRRLADKGLVKASYKGEETFTITDAGRKLVTDAVRAEKKARNAKTTASGRIVDADRDLRRMVRNIPRPPKG